MRKSTLSLTTVAVVLACGYLQGKEPAPNHLGCFDDMIGTWRYEGPLLEDVPDIAKKGTNLVFQFTWKRILKRIAIEETWSIEFQGGEILEGKAMIGWHAGEKRIVYGGINASGGMNLGGVTADAASKSTTLTAEGVDGDGEKTSIKATVTVKDRDTITWRALDRKGGIVEGPSPEYEFKRDKRIKRTKAAK